MCFSRTVSLSRSPLCVCGACQCVGCVCFFLFFFLKYVRCCCRSVYFSFSLFSCVLFCSIWDTCRDTYVSIRIVDLFGGAHVIHIKYESKHENTIQIESENAFKFYAKRTNEDQKVACFDASHTHTHSFSHSFRTHTLDLKFNMDEHKLFFFSLLFGKEFRWYAAKICQILFHLAIINGNLNAGRCHFVANWNLLFVLWLFNYRNLSSLFLNLRPNFFHDAFCDGESFFGVVASIIEVCLKSIHADDMTGVGW